jgi:hypothetical protein
MHHPTYYQVMLEQGVQIDIVNQQPTRISTSYLSFQEPPLIGNAVPAYSNVGLTMVV